MITIVRSSYQLGNFQLTLEFITDLSGENKLGVKGWCPDCSLSRSSLVLSAAVEYRPQTATSIFNLNSDNAGSTPFDIRRSQLLVWSVEYSKCHLR
jgi:hypothetical protein